MRVCAREEEVVPEERRRPRVLRVCVLVVRGGGGGRARARERGIWQARGVPRPRGRGLPVELDEGAAALGCGDGLARGRRRGAIKGRTAGVGAVPGETGLDALLVAGLLGGGSAARGGCGALLSGAGPYQRALARVALVHVEREEVAAGGGGEQGATLPSATRTLTYGRTGRRSFVTVRHG